MLSIPGCIKYQTRLLILIYLLTKQNNMEMSFFSTTYLHHNEGKRVWNELHICKLLQVCKDLNVNRIKE